MKYEKCIHRERVRQKWWCMAAWCWWTGNNDYVLAGVLVCICVKVFQSQVKSEPELQLAVLSPRRRDERHSRTGSSYDLGNPAMRWGQSGEWMTTTCLPVYSLKNALVTVARAEASSKLFFAIT